MRKILSVMALCVILMSMTVSASAAHWYDKYVDWGVENNIICEGFDPAKDMIRGDALRMLKAKCTRTYCYTIAEARAWAMELGISDGERMYDWLTRAEMVTLIGRTTGEKALFALPFYDAATIPPWAYQYVCSAFMLGTVNGTEDGGFHPNDHLNGAMAVTMVCRMKQ